jgi:hypothetical protein
MTSKEKAMNQFFDSEIQSELESLGLQTLQGFWRLEKLLEEIHHEQIALKEEIAALKLAAQADIS